MKTIKFGGLQKMITILIVAIVIVMIVGVAASGLNSENEIPSDSNNDTNNGSNETPNDNPHVDQIPEEPLIPDYVNYITGLETNEDSFAQKPIAFVVSPTSPLYGVGNSDLVIEIPCENGETRLLTYSSSIDESGKIGALMPTRNYITSLTSAFGGILAAYGNDDIVSYQSIIDNLPLDVSVSSNFFYTENARFIFSSAKLINRLIEEEGIITTAVKNPNMPYSFADFGTEIIGHGKAETIYLGYSDNLCTKLVYNKDTGTYSFFKGQTQKNDMLTGENVDFVNAFVLFADTVTYDRSSGVETVTDTLSQGSGYYATKGTFVEIRWRTNTKGELIFEDLDGNILTVNRGNSYIGYFRASGYDDVRIY